MTAAYYDAHPEEAQEIRDAGRGHLLPDYDPDWYEQDEGDWHEYICELQEARIDAGDGADEGDV